MRRVDVFRDFICILALRLGAKMASLAPKTYFLKQRETCISRYLKEQMSDLEG